MPEGIIRDPKQNPRERDFGIVYCTESDDTQDVGKNFRYQKIWNDYSRLFMAGEVVRFEITDRNPQEIEDIIISGSCMINCYLPDNEQERKAPVNKVLIRTVAPAARANAINNAIRHQRMESDFGNNYIPSNPPPPVPICPPGMTK